MEKPRLRLKSRLGWIRVPIRGGPLKGLKWSVVAGKRFIDGRYEPMKTEALLAQLREGDVVVDVGAHTGYYTVIASKLVGTTGKVFAFEPRPVNASLLRNHLKVNGIDNVTVFEKAVSSSTGEALFDVSRGTGRGRLSDTGELPVETRSLDELLDQSHIDEPTFLKIDVEGGEVGVLAGAKRLIDEGRPRILVATHSDETHQSVTRFLDENRYDYSILDPGGESGDTEILACPR